jgi:uridine kinase
MKKGILVGIAGASASGKTLVAGNIVQGLGAHRAVTIPEDAYYRDLSDMPCGERADINFDHPDAFDHDLLAEHLTRLLQGESISRPIYDYKTHTRLPHTEIVAARPLVLVEGILVLSHTRLRELMDIRVFVDTALDICLARRIKRDVAERGRTVSSVSQQFEINVRPMYLQFIEPSRRHAHIIIPEGGKNTKAIGIVTAGINALLSDLGTYYGKKEKEYKGL